MASTAIQVVPGVHTSEQNFSPSFPPANVALDVDLLSVFPEYLGIPFMAFEQSATPTASPWTLEMQSLAQSAQASGKPLFLQLGFVRANMVPLAVILGNTSQAVSGWALPCPNFTTSTYAPLLGAYVNYVTWMTNLFQPRYLVTATEINLYYFVCGGNTASWRALVNALQAAYAAAKAVNPSIVAFPSLNLEALYDNTATGFDQKQYAAMGALSHDRLGLAAYPAYLGNPYMVPSDFLTRISNYNPNEAPVVITETGWNSTPVALTVNNQCAQPFGFYSEPSFETAYLNFLLNTAFNSNFDAVTWWSDRDLILSQVMTTCYPQASPPSYSQCYGDEWCITDNAFRQSGGAGGEFALKAFGSMGLRNYDGTPKSQLSIWDSFLSLPYTPPANLVERRATAP